MSVIPAVLCRGLPWLRAFLAHAVTGRSFVISCPFLGAAHARVECFRFPLPPALAVRPAFGEVEPGGLLTVFSVVVAGVLRPGVACSRLSL